MVVWCVAAADSPESDPQAPAPAAGHQPGQAWESGHASRDTTGTTRQCHPDGTLAGRWHRCNLSHSVKKCKGHKFELIHTIAPVLLCQMGQCWHGVSVGKYWTMDGWLLVLSLIDGSTCQLSAHVAVTRVSLSLLWVYCMGDCWLVVSESSSISTRVFQFILKGGFFHVSSFSEKMLLPEETVWKSNTLTLLISDTTENHLSQFVKKII